MQDITSTPAQSLAKVGHAPCPTCGGIGSVIDHDATYDPFAWVPSLEWVPHVEEVPCPTCRASGVVEVTQ